MLNMDTAIRPTAWKIFSKDSPVVITMEKLKATVE